MGETKERSTSSKEPIEVFLSHRQDDVAIADIIRKHLYKWGFDQKVFQSTSPGHGVSPGDEINPAIKDALRQAKLIILIYTQFDEDWSYCIWECGLATDLNTVKNKIVIFKFTNKEPKPYGANLMVNINRAELKNFVLHLLKVDHFLPGISAKKPTISDEMINTYVDDLFRELEPIKITGETEKRYRWDYFTIEICSSDISDIMKKKESDASVEELTAVCRITDYFGEALKHFGYLNLEDEITLEKLINRWRDKTSGRSFIDDSWVNEIKAEIYRAIENSPANPEWKSFNSVHYSDLWFYPVLHLARIRSNGSMEFIVYCYRSQSPKNKKERGT